MKLPAARCARLMLAGMTRPSKSNGVEMWMGVPPSIMAFYLQKWLPQRIFAKLERRIGRLRMTLWKHKLDVYDRANWKQGRAILRKQNTAIEQ